MTSVPDFSNDLGSTGCSKVRNQFILMSFNFEKFAPFCCNV